MSLASSKPTCARAFRSAPTAAASNAAIAQAAYRAYVTKDRAALEALLADEFHFTSPLDNRLDRDRHIVEVEVYFGWSLPHKAPRGSFVDAA
jgi:hypothetical protein